jgi:hypothetical protein
MIFAKFNLKNSAFFLCPEWLKKTAQYGLMALTMIFLTACGSSDDCPSTEIKIASKTITPVTKENYALAESQVIFSEYMQKIGKATCTNGLGKLMHLRQQPDPKDRTILRINFDTIYSFAILDLTEPVTVVLPPTDGRYQSAMVMDDRHNIPLLFTKPGTYQLTQVNVGSRYAILGIRTQVNIQDPSDLTKVHALQDKVKLEQKELGNYVQGQNWNMDEILAMRKQYQERAVKEAKKSEDIFGKKGSISQDNVNFGVAVGWGGMPKEGAVYLFYDKNSDQAQTLTLKNVPNGDNAFWSITVYDSEGYPVGKNFNLNSAFAKANDQGEVVVHFGGDTSQPNYLEIYPNWTATLRIYNPKPSYFNGTWTQPRLQAVAATPKK